MPAQGDKGAEPSKAAATNRKARRDYHVLQKLEAGIELRGTEVKSLRQGRVSLGEGYARIERGEVVLHGVHILPYEHGNIHNHDPLRPRRLLLHSHEIAKLIGLVQEKGCTLVPLRLYFKKGRAKIELGVCKGKHTQDKREDLKRKTADREAERAIRASRKR
ncbi:MAG: SsrA-binding protein SmpB [Verrucomicrobia bacterium]|nr:SsrA-binding protein SmpB [Verrucomicrobiota bacterium]